MSAREWREERRGFPWFLLTGLVLGVVFGLAYAWWINPVVYEQSGPEVLTGEQRDQYLRLVALSYASNHDVGRSAARLALLEAKDPADQLSALAQQVVVEGGSGDEARALAALAAALRSAPASAPSAPDASKQGQTRTSTPGARPQSAVGGTDIPVDAVRSATPPPDPADTATPEATFTARPTPTASPTVGAPFVLDDTAVLCDSQQDRGLMQVQVNDSAGQAIPGMAVVINWDGGQEVFYTGLAPDISPGYADYEMQTGLTYSVRVGEGGEAVGGLSAPECKDASGGGFYGGLRLTFKQP